MTQLPLLGRSTLVLSILLVGLTGCDGGSATSPFDGAYLATFTVSGVATEASRNEVTVANATVTSVFTNVSSNPHVVVPALGTTFETLTLEKFPDAPIWSPNDGGLYEAGRAYAIFAGLLVDGGGNEVYTAWLGFEQALDLPTAPARDGESYAGVPAERILECLAAEYEREGDDRRFRALSLDVERSRVNTDETDCYSTGTLQD